MLNAPKEMIFQELTPDVKINVKLIRHNLKCMYPHSNSEIPPSNNFFSGTEAISPGHNDPRTVCDILGHQNISTYKILDSFLKKIQRKCSGYNFLELRTEVKITVRDTLLLKNVSTHDFSRTEVMFYSH